MRNLVIVGNGFDLSHGLETKYSHFIQAMTDNPEKYESQNNQLDSNVLLQALANNKYEMWSDIEYTYYKILSNFEDKVFLQSYFGDVYQYKTIEQLNNDFSDIKDWLCKYLVNEEKKFDTNKNYEKFFEQFHGKETVVLNFNYTNTVKSYLEKYNSDIELIHIHGELRSEENPIIFGFAASNEDSKKLLIENDNQYVRNIKKFNYLFTHNYERLKSHLKSEEFNLFILGHSCGVSDSLILSEIFNTGEIYKIYPFYHKDKDGYFDTMVNIDRIIDDYSKGKGEKDAFTTLVSFPNSYKMPQKEYDDNLIDYLEKILKTTLPKELEIQKKQEKDKALSHGTIFSLS